MSNSRVLRSCCVLVCLLLLVPNFLSVRSNAADSDNIVEVNLNDWLVVNSLGNYNIAFSNGLNTITLSPDSTLRMSNLSLVDLFPTYNSSHSYKFSIDIKAPSVPSGELSIGFGFGSIDDNEEFTLLPDYSYESRVSSIDDFTTYSASIKGSSGVNICACMYFITGISSSNTKIYIKNISIIDQTLADQQIILDNQNRNAQDIQDNADKNAQEIKDNADENTSKIGGWFIELGDKIKDIFYIDNILPAVWETGSISGTAGSDASLTEYYCRSSFIDIPDDYGSFLINLRRFFRLRVYKYDLNHNFLEYFELLGSDILNNPYELDPGYSYRLVVVSNSTWGVPDPSTMPNYTYIQQKVFFVTALVNQLKVLLRDLFVPSDVVITGFKSNMENLLQDHLGILYTSADFIGDYISSLRDLLNSEESTITFPAINFNFNGRQFNLSNSHVVDVSFLQSGFWAVFYGMYKVFLNVICIFALINYAFKTYEKTISN